MKGELYTEHEVSAGISTLTEQCSLVKYEIALKLNLETKSYQKIPGGRK
jgi:hypothetical protein